MDAINQITELIQSHHNIVFFTGAGASTASGAKDFRSEDGVYNISKGKVPYEPERMLSRQMFETDTASQYQFIMTYMNHDGLEPKICHTFPKYLEDQGKHVSIVTQNADGLHQEAGSNHVYDLHGNERDLYCIECGEHFTMDEINIHDDSTWHCPNDGGLVRLTAVMFGESLDTNTLQGAITAIKQSDLLFVIGTSLNVYPAAGLLQYYTGNQMVVINKEDLHIANSNIISIKDDAAKALSQVKENLLENLNLIRLK
ncbi:NAD-dependent protein deacylase [Aerococcaceae bacterium DSM 111020]|nr:NAD-dependent protein deacylase [Aerococcaceae bacterium DSM 111020]